MSSLGVQVLHGKQTSGNADGVNQSDCQGADQGDGVVQPGETFSLLTSP